MQEEPIKRFVKSVYKFFLHRLCQIIDYICYDEERIYYELIEQQYTNFFRCENSLFNLLELDIQKKVMSIIFKLICNNKENSSFILEQELLNEINTDFNKEFPLNFKEN